MWDAKSIRAPRVTYRDNQKSFKLKNFKLKSFKAVIKATDLQGRLQVLPGIRQPKCGDTYLGLGLGISTEGG